MVLNDAKISEIIVGNQGNERKEGLPSFPGKRTKSNESSLSIRREAEQAKRCNADFPLHGRPFTTETEENGAKIYKNPESNRPFLKIKNDDDPSVIEIRIDKNLKNVLMDKYETAARSEFFGTSGISIVHSGQISNEDIYSLIKLSYDLAA